jgi:predicted transglutaminase-like cysteine proteinase
MRISLQTWKGRLGRRWPARVVVVLCCSITLVWAQGLSPSSAVIQWAKQKYGSTAVDRLYAWQGLMEKNRNKSELEKLRLVNDFFNGLNYSTDQQLWGKNDYWATPVEALSRGGADCEDYSIAKYFTLRELGVPDEKLRITYVKALKLNAHHMVLAYYPTPTSVPLVLDNLNGRILPATERKDLEPIYSFNGDGLWLAKSRGGGQRMGTSDRIKMWEDLNARMRAGPQ